MTVKINILNEIMSRYCGYISLGSDNLVPRVSLLCLPWLLEERPWLRLVTCQAVTQTFPPGWGQPTIFVDLS